MRSYVLGFLFDGLSGSVILIQKDKPDWQKGLLNGVGGKIEEGETPLAAMVREFAEETGANTDPEIWNNFCTLQGDDFVVHCFKAKSTAMWTCARTRESEFVVKVEVRDLHLRRCVTNVNWLIPLALDENDGRPFHVAACYS